MFGGGWVAVDTFSPADLLLQIMWVVVKRVVDILKCFYSDLRKSIGVALVRI